MEINVVIVFGLFCVGLFMMIVHSFLVARATGKYLKAADKRLEKANEMVLTLAHSADALASSISELKDMMIHLEQAYTKENAVIVQSRVEYREAYKKLLNRYEELQRSYDSIQQDTMMKYAKYSEDMFNTVKEMARKPTINNAPVQK